VILDSRFSIWLPRVPFATLRLLTPGERGEAEKAVSAAAYRESSIPALSSGAG